MENSDIIREEEVKLVYHNPQGFKVLMNEDKATGELTHLQKASNPRGGVLC